MPLRNVNTTDTIETFRTTFNTLASDVGNLDSLSTTDKSSIVAAVNEALGATFTFTLRDSSSSVQTISGNDTLNVVGASNEVTATVTATDTLTIGLADTISGITSLTASTLSDGTASLNSGSFTGLVNVTGSGTANFTTDVQVNSTSVATKPFAIAQAIALG